MKNHYMNSSLKNKYCSKGSAIAEFAPALMVLFLIIIFPLINFLGMASASMSINTMVNNLAVQVSKTLSFNEALQILRTNSSSLNQSGLAKFAKSVPIGGYQNLGVDLYIVQMNISASDDDGSIAQISDANQPWNKNQINLSNYIYQYKLVGRYSLIPFICMSNIPLLNSIPGLGAPWNYTTQTLVSVEHPSGLDNGSNYVLSNGMYINNK